MYHIEKRLLVLNIYYKIKSMRKTSLLTNVSISSISRWIKNIYNKKEKIISKLPLIIDLIKTVLSYFPFYTVKDIQKHINKTLNLTCSYSLIYTIMKKHVKLSYKKIKYQNFLNKDILNNKISLFKHEFSKLKLISNNFVFIDEIGFNDSIKPIYSWSEKGKKLYIDHKINTKSRNNKSVCSYITNEGKISYCISNIPYNKNILLDYMKTFNFPKSTIIIMDNVSFHHSKIIKNYIESQNWKLLYIPPYSPDFNPIENIFSKIKNQYRKCKNIENSFDIISQNDIINCINHCFKNIYI
jgi:transposase